MMDIYALPKAFEGFAERIPGDPGHVRAYPDPESGGDPWTCGWGSTRWADGRPVRPGDVMGIADAEAALEAYVQREIMPTLERLPGWAEMTDEQRSAMVDFAYNLGPGDLLPPHTLGCALAEHRWSDVPAALLLYSDPGTACHEGLLRRREAEAVLWRQGMQIAIDVKLDTGHGPRSVPAHAYLTGGHVMVSVRAMCDAIGYTLAVEGTPATVTATITDAMQTPHTLPLTITDGVGYVRAVDLARELGLTASFDAAAHTLTFSAPTD